MIIKMFIFQDLIWCVEKYKAGHLQPAQQYLDKSTFILSKQKKLSLEVSKVGQEWGDWKTYLHKYYAVKYIFLPCPFRM